MYRYEAISISGFVQQLAVSYVGNGHWFYVRGTIPPGKDPSSVDAKLIERYEINISKWTRARRRKLGLANVHYLRHGRSFVLIASRGEHRFFGEERNIRDVRRDSIRFHDYNIGYKRGTDGRFHPSVRIHPEAYGRLKIYFKHIALHWSVEALLGEFQHIGFEFYAPVRRQVWNLLRRVNRMRSEAGAEQIPWAAINWRRAPTLVFTLRPKNNDASPQGAPSQMLSADT